MEMRDFGKLGSKDRRASLRRHEDEILANQNACAERTEIERNKKLINNFDTDV